MRSLLLALLLAPAALGAQVSGFVHTGDGVAVEGATVRAGGASVTTNAEGAFVVKEVANGVVELTVEKDGLGRTTPLVLSGDMVGVTLSGATDELSPWDAPGKGEGTIA